MTDYEVVQMDPKKLAGNPRNFRKHPPRQVVALDQSMDEQGWVLPVLWNKRTKRLIDGHARVWLAKQKGEKSVPVHVLDLDEDQERRLLASLDRITNLAEIEDQVLAQLLKECAEASSLPPGYSLEEYEDLLNALQGPDEDPADPEPEEDEEEELELSHIRMVQLFYSESDLKRFEGLANAVQGQAGTKNVSETMLWLLEHWTGPMS